MSSGSSLVANVACTTQSTEGSPTAAILDLAEQQNVESIAALPETTVAPKADRIKLPIGDVLRVRWGFVIDAPETSVGYLFVSGSLVVTCVFSSASDVVDTKEPAWRAILATFKPRP